MKPEDVVQYSRSGTTSRRGAMRRSDEMENGGVRKRRQRGALERIHKEEGGQSVGSCRLALLSGTIPTIRVSGSNSPFAHATHALLSDLPVCSNPVRSTSQITLADCDSSPKHSNASLTFGLDARRKACLDLETRSKTVLVEVQSLIFDLTLLNYLLIFVFIDGCSEQPRRLTLTSFSREELHGQSHTTVVER